jgi:ribonucleoside-diphosphate reductase alpha chain
MRIINAAGTEIKAGGGRRTALMLCLNLTHGDIEEFLDSKINLGEIENANISVVFGENPEDFFAAVDNGKGFAVHWRGQVVHTIPARRVWEKILQNALKNGEPGILNGYYANRMSNCWYYKPLISTNPCGEIWLSEYDCCCLGALVLPRFIRGKDLDWNSLRDTISTAVRFLDNVLTVNNYPLQEIRDTCHQLRRIGLGVMGLHDMLLRLGLRYSEPRALEFVDKVMKRIKFYAYEASVELAKEKGAFPLYDERYLQSKFVKSLKPTLRKKIQEHGIRNVALLTIAPTGTTSILSGCTSGIEPMFAPAYERKYRDGDKLATETVVHPTFKDMFLRGDDVSIAEGALSLSLLEHLEMQRVCQRHVDNAVSKTINLPEGTTSEELSKAYREFLPELKGITVYPNGSRDDQPLTPLPLDKALEHVQTAIEEPTAIDCPGGMCEL